MTVVWNVLRASCTFPPPWVHLDSHRGRNPAHKETLLTGPIFPNFLPLEFILQKQEDYCPGLGLIPNYCCGAISSYGIYKGLPRKGHTPAVRENIIPETCKP